MLRLIRRQFPKHSLWSLLFIAVVAWAGTTYADFLRALAEQESSMNQNAVNQFGYAGLYQMGTPALQDAGYKNSSGAWTGKDGINSQADFLANAQAQTNAITAYHQAAWNAITANGLDAYIGQSVNGIPITASGLVAGYHLLGLGNASHPGLLAFLQDGTVGTDGNDTAITSYIAKFGGYGLPVIGTTIASVLAAKPTGGVGKTTTTHTTVIPPNLSSGSTVFGGTTGPSFTPKYSTSMAGFEGAAGQPMGTVRNMFVLVAGAAALLWLAYSTFGAWSAFADGRLELREMSTTIVRGMVVISLLMLLLW
jgi:hypothetical protein